VSSDWKIRQRSAAHAKHIRLLQPITISTATFVDARWMNTVHLLRLTEALAAIHCENITTGMKCIPSSAGQSYTERFSKAARWAYNYT